MMMNSFIYFILFIIISLFISSYYFIIINKNKIINAFIIYSNLLTLKMLFFIKNMN